MPSETEAASYSLEDALAAIAVARADPDHAVERKPPKPKRESKKKAARNTQKTKAAKRESEGGQEVHGLAALSVNEGEEEEEEEKHPEPLAAAEADDDVQELHYELDARMPVSDRFRTFVDQFSNNHGLRPLFTAATAESHKKWSVILPKNTETAKILSDNGSLGTMDRPDSQKVVYLSPDLSHGLIDERMRNLGMLAKKDDLQIRRYTINLEPSKLLVLSDAKVVHDQIFSQSKFMHTKAPQSKHNHGHRVNWDALRATFKAILFPAHIVGTLESTEHALEYPTEFSFMTSYAPNTLIVFEESVLSGLEVEEVHNVQETETSPIGNIHSTLKTAIFRMLMWMHVEPTIDVYDKKQVWPMDETTDEYHTVPHIWYGPTMTASAVSRMTTIDYGVKKQTGGKFFEFPAGTTDTVSKLQHADKTHEQYGTVIPDQVALDSFRRSSTNCHPHWYVGMRNIDWTKKVEVQAAASTFSISRDIRVKAPDGTFFGGSRFGVNFPSDATALPVVFQMAPFLTERTPGGPELRAAMKNVPQNAIMQLSFSGDGGLPRVDVIVPQPTDEASSTPQISTSAPPLHLSGIRRCPGDTSAHDQI